MGTGVWGAYRSSRHVAGMCRAICDLVMTGTTSGGPSDGTCSHRMKAETAPVVAISSDASARGASCVSVISGCPLASAAPVESGSRTSGSMPSSILIACAVLLRGGRPEMTPVTCSCAMAAESWCETSDVASAATARISSILVVWRAAGVEMSRCGPHRVPATPLPLLVGLTVSSAVVPYLTTSPAYRIVELVTAAIRSHEKSRVRGYRHTLYARHEEEAAAAVVLALRKQVRA